jgi:hypothetical protein
LRGYALAALDEYHCDVEFVTLIEVWLMKGTYKVERVSIDELEQFRERLVKQHELAGKQFSAGPWCKFCPRWFDCPTRDQYVRAAGNALLEHIGDNQEVSRETLAKLWDRSKVLERALDEYKKAVRVEVDKGGPIELGDGRQLTIQSEERQSFPDARAVAERTGIDINEFAKVSKTALTTAIKATVPKGKGAKRVRETIADLEALGLVETKTIKILRATKQ